MNQWRKSFHLTSPGSLVCLWARVNVTAVGHISQKHAGRWISYSTLPLGVKMCVHDVLQWTGVWSMVYGPILLPASQARLGFYYIPVQDKAVSEDEWKNEWINERTNPVGSWSLNDYLSSMPSALLPDNGGTAGQNLFGSMPRNLHGTCPQTLRILCNSYLPIFPSPLLEKLTPQRFATSGFLNNCVTLCAHSIGWAFTRAFVVFTTPNSPLCWLPLINTSVIHWILGTGNTGARARFLFYHSPR